MKLMYHRTTLLFQLPRAVHRPSQLISRQISGQKTVAALATEGAGERRRKVSYNVSPSILCLCPVIVRETAGKRGICNSLRDLDERWQLTQVALTTTYLPRRIQAWSHFLKWTSQSSSQMV